MFFVNIKILDNQFTNYYKYRGDKMSSKIKATVVAKKSTVEKEDDINIVKIVWKFMNKSPILSAIIISMAAIIGSQGYKLYTYIYWLPYFKLFEVPTYYFEDVVFDKYELLLKIAPRIIPIILLFIFFNFLEKKSNATIEGSLNPQSLSRRM